MLEVISCALTSAVFLFDTFLSVDMVYCFYLYQDTCYDLLHVHLVSFFDMNIQVNSEPGVGPVRGSLYTPLSASVGQHTTTY